MEREKGRKVTQIDSDKPERFIVMSMSNPLDKVNEFEFGLYDAEVDAIVITETIDPLSIYDLNKHTEELIRVRKVFDDKIKELKEE